MFKLLHRLRQKPEKKREAIVLAISFGVTALIAALWLIALVIKIHSGAFTFDVSQGDKDAVGKSAESIKNSWDTFMSDVSKTVQSPSAAPAATTTEASVPPAPTDVPDATSTATSTPLFIEE